MKIFLLFMLPVALAAKWEAESGIDPLATSYRQSAGVIATGMPPDYNKPSIYDFKVPGLDGKTIDFSAYRGKKILIVNTASKCGYTKQYEGLEKLYEQYKEKLVIVGFPANNFGGQEPGTNEEIDAFCKKNYGVSFPIAAKVSVKGEDIHPLFKYLVAEAEKQGVKDPVIGWNFTKFLLDEKGRLAKVFPSKITPLSDELVGYIR